MLGLVPGIMPRPVSAVPAVPVTQRLLVLAWNAASQPPPIRPVMLGLVVVSIPRPVSAVPALPVTQRALVLVWNATS
jgi:hypothetical protein